MVCVDWIVVLRVQQQRLPKHCLVKKEETIRQYTEVNTTGLEEDTLNYLNEIRTCKVIDNENESKVNIKSDKKSCDHTDNELETVDILSDLVIRLNQKTMSHSDNDIEKQKGSGSRQTSSDNKMLKTISLVMMKIIGKATSTVLNQRWLKKIVYRQLLMEKLPKKI